MSRPINEQTWHRLPTSSSVRVHLMDWPDKGGHGGTRLPDRTRAYTGGHKGRPYHGGTRLPDRTRAYTGGHKGRPYHAVRGCRIVQGRTRAATRAARTTAVRGCRIVRAALVAALPGKIPRTVLAARLYVTPRRAYQNCCKGASQGLHNLNIAILLRLLCRVEALAG